MIFIILISFIFDKFPIEINKDYYVDYIDSESQMSIFYTYNGKDDIGVVNETVFAVGYNDEFIIAKQHPDGNKQITNYLIIPLKFKLHIDPEENKFGPLNFQEFQNKRIELKIPKNLQFTEVFENLE